jgi:hypothetical protein
MDSNHRIGQIINLILALLLLLGIALTVYAIDRVRTIKSEAASPKTTPTTSTITLNESNPKRGDTVSVTLTGMPKLKGSSAPFVSVVCFQNQTTIVYQYAEWPPDKNWDSWVPKFTLTDALWASGSANCKADFAYYIWKGQTETELVYLAHTTFNVAE